MRFFSWLFGVVVGALGAFFFLKWYAEKEANRVSDAIVAETERINAEIEKIKGQSA
jgi:hypothetical protein